jgi:hypothetical protein
VEIGVINVEVVNTLDYILYLIMINLI